MKKIIYMIISAIFINALLSCSNITKENKTYSEVLNMNELELKIEDYKINVIWEDNNSVHELIKLAKDGINISMHKYGNFEQVGPIGHNIKSNDVNMTTNIGDIVLYSSNQIVIFYGSNTWDYTKLGRINLSNEKIIELFGNEDVIINIKSN